MNHGKTRLCTETPKLLHLAALIHNLDWYFSHNLFHLLPSPYKVNTHRALLALHLDFQTKKTD